MADGIGLREVLETQGRRSTWVARSLDPPVHPSTVSLWCSGDRPIPESRVAELAQLLGVSEVEIRGEVAEKAEA